MQQIIMTEPGKIEYREAEVPGYSENQVLIKTLKIGICGSDIHVYHGKHPFTSYPIIQGHEIAGQVCEVGSAVKNINAGDIVTVIPQVTCENCYPCRHGDYHICDTLKVLGFQTDGVAGDYFVIDADKVLKTDGIGSVADVALIEPIAVAVHAVKRIGDVAGKKLVVLGAGPIGNLTGQVAKALGAEEVLMTDVSDYRLEVAEKCGIDHCVNTKDLPLKDAIEKFYGNDKADAIYDCAGVPSTITAAVDCARKGSSIVIVAVFEEKPPMDLSVIQDRELKLIGTLMYKNEDWDAAIDILKAGKINTDLIISKSFPCSEYLEAYHYIEEQKDKVMKVVIDFD